MSKPTLKSFSFNGDGSVTLTVANVGTIDACTDLVGVVRQVVSGEQLPAEVPTADQPAAPPARGRRGKASQADKGDGEGEAPTTGPMSQPRVVGGSARSAPARTARGTAAAPIDATADDDDGGGDDDVDNAGDDDIDNAGDDDGGDEIPKELLTAQKPSDVFRYLIQQGFDSEPKLLAECKRLQDGVPALKSAKNLEAKVKRAAEVLL